MLLDSPGQPALRRSHVRDPYDREGHGTDRNYHAADPSTIMRTSGEDAFHAGDGDDVIRSASGVWFFARSGSHLPEIQRRVATPRPPRLRQLLRAGGRDAAESLA